MEFLFNTTLLILRRAGKILLELWPYVVVGVLIGEVIKYTSWTKLIHKFISRSPLQSVFFAVILGMVSPLCTYGTVPIVLQIFRSGVHLSPLVAFLSASTLMNPQLFVITMGGLGLEMALVRAGAVFIFGLILGLIIYKIPLPWITNPGALEDKKKEEENKKRPKKVFTFKKFIKDLGNSVQFVGFYLIIGILLGAFVEVVVPAKWIITLFQPGSWYSVLLAITLGVPLYACGGGTIPLIRSFMEQGMSKGAALGFLLVGPATRITPLMALATIIKPWVIAVYVTMIMLFSLVTGIIYG